MNMRVRRVLNVLILYFTLVSGGEHPDGDSKVSRSQDVLGNYHFSYKVRNPEGEQFRQEGTDSLGRVVGSYGMTHSDGTHRIVDYVADKGGFRAEVRSNEPGVASAESADVTIVRTDDLPLTVAASQDAREVYGTRIKVVSPQVDYVDKQSEAKKETDHSDNSPRESRQRNFDDYRPRSPVAYYPGDVQVTIPSRQLSPPVFRPDDVHNSRARTPIDTRPLDVYLPPIDPHTAVRRPAYYTPRDRGADRTFLQTTTSRRPFIPPYGGFDDDPLPVDRRPGVSLTTAHGGLGNDHLLPSPAPTPSYGSGRYPLVDSPVQRDFGLPRFPLNSEYPNVPRHTSGFPSPPQNVAPGVHFSPPNYDNGIAPPNFVLRAVPIPNGIQAVRVDPSTGRVYERLTYPLFLRQDGHPAYDRNILLHNDDISDDDAIRNDNPGYLDIPFGRRPNFRGARNRPFDDSGDYRGGSRQYNRSYGFDEKNLSKPSARDLAWIQRQLSLVEGFNKNQFPDEFFTNNLPFRNYEYSSLDGLDDTEDEQRFRSNVPDSKVPLTGSSLFDRSNDGTYSRNPRHSDVLTSSDSKPVSLKKEEKEEMDSERTEVVANISGAEKV